MCAQNPKRRMEEKGLQHGHLSWEVISCFLSLSLSVSPASAHILEQKSQNKKSSYCFGEHIRAPGFARPWVCGGIWLGEVLDWILQAEYALAKGGEAWGEAGLLLRREEDVTKGEVALGQCPELWAGCHKSVE